MILPISVHIGSYQGGRWSIRLTAALIDSSFSEADAFGDSRAAEASRRFFSGSLRRTGETASVRVENIWYRTIDDFFNNASIDGRKLISLNSGLYAFEILK